MLIWDGTNWVNTPAPTKTSDLTNDGENGSDPFITEGEVTNILNGLNPDGTPDASNPGYLKPGDNVSELNNDANYITDTDTAADSNKLCGEDCDYYLDYQNFVNTPDLSGTGLWEEDSGKLYPTTLSNNVQVGGTAAAPNITLNADGSAGFAGTVSSSDTNASNVTFRGVLNGVVKYGVYADGTTKIGSAGNALSSPNIILKADGSAAMSGDVAIGDSTTFRDNAAIIAALPLAIRETFKSALSKWEKATPYVPEDAEHVTCR